MLSKFSTAVTAGRLNFAGYARVTLISVALLSFIGCDTPDVTPAPPKKVKAIKLGDVSALVERSFPGRARAAQEVNLSFRVSGPLVELPVNVGDAVTRGDLIARIDPTDFESRMQTMRGKLQQAISARDLAAAEFKRAADIRTKNADLISASEYDKRVGDRNTTQAQVQELESVLKLAEDDLAHTFLTAPFDGVIAATYVENFENVLAKRSIARLLDTDRIEVVVNVPERLISYAPYLLSATVSFDALADIALEAQVKEVGSEASAVTRTYPVTLIMDQPEGVEIKPGMAARARLVSQLPEQAREVGMSIPATALFSGDNADDSYVFIVDESSMTLEKRQVELSLLSSTGVLVKSGLQAGDWLVIAGVHSVEEGQEVRILDAVAEGARQ
jgi:RND family efflux transporter MFP subunit